MYRIGKEETAAVERVIESRDLFRINKGTREVLTFEQELREKFGISQSLYLTSGTAALISILTAMGIGPGDEVIVPAYTFIASPNAVLATGAIPVLAEVDATLTMDPADVENKITDRTKAIMPVHICGFPCNMDAIMAVAKRHNLTVVEDACQAVGASYKGKRLGTIGHAGAYSFNFFKIISAGEGGAVVTDDQELYERALIFHDVGTPYWSYERELAQTFFVGSQFRANEICAAVMRVQLTRLDGILADLRRIKKTMAENLAGRKNIAFIPSNDIAGDMGTVLPFRFETEALARKFSETLGNSNLPVDVNRHVFIYWKPILEKRGAYNERMNPYNMPYNQNGKFEITKDSGPNSLGHLSRTVYVYMQPDMQPDAIDQLTEKCAATAAEL